MKPWHGDVDLEPLGDPNLGALTVQTMRLKKLRELEAWLDSRPSATMDPCLELRERTLREVRQLRLEIREAGRPKHRRPTAMMIAQNAALDTPS